MSNVPQKSPAEQLATPVQFLKGVGPQRAELLAKLDLHYAADVLFFFPRTYQDMSELREISQLEEKRMSSVVGVIDDGPGIAPEIRSRIFDPFFTTKPVGAGTGLGLDIVRRLVQRHNGEIDVDSQPGHTEFRVRLPIADAAVSTGNP